MKDPYVYENQSNVLKNKLDIMNENDLKNEEAFKVFKKNEVYFRNALVLYNDYNTENPPLEEDRQHLKRMFRNEVTKKTESEKQQERYICHNNIEME